MVCELNLVSSRNHAISKPFRKQAAFQNNCYNQFSLTYKLRPCFSCRSYLMTRRGVWFPKVLNVSMLQLLIYSYHNRKSMVSHGNNREYIKLLLCTHANKRTMVFCSTNRDHAQAVVFISWQQEEHGFL